jgi:hypothetical protein
MTLTLSPDLPVWELLRPVVATVFAQRDFFAGRSSLIVLGDAVLP